MKNWGKRFVEPKLKASRWPIIYVVSFGVLLMFGFYNDALFFAPANTYTTVAILLVGCIITGIIVFKRKFAVPYWTMFALLYGFYATLTYLWGDAPSLAVQGALTIGAAISMMVFVPHLATKYRLAMLWLISGLGVVLLLFALANAVGWFHFKDAIQDNMIDSVFQYHNSFGSYELAAFSVSTLISTRFHGNKGLLAGVVLSALCLSGVELSFSREVWLLVPIMIIGLVIAGKVTGRGQRTVMMVCGSIVVSLAGFSFFDSTIKHGDVKKLLVGIVVTVVTALIVSVFIRFFESIKQRRTKIILVIAVIAVLVIGLAFVLLTGSSHGASSILQRVGSISVKSTSFTQRFWYYSNALRIWLDNPVFGGGFGTWTTKFQAYEQYPYYSAMTHSFLFDQLDSVGVMGLLALVTFIVLVVISCIRVVKRDRDKAYVYLAALCGGASLLLHSLFDFDMNFPMMLFVFFTLLALSTDPDWQQDKVSLKVRSYYGAGFMVVSSVLVVVGGGLAVSQSIFNQAKTVHDSSKQIALLKRASSFAPYDPAIHLQLATDEFNVFASTKNQQYGVDAWYNTNRAVNHAKWDPGVQEAAAQIAFHMGYFPQALDWSQASYRDGKYGTLYPRAYMGIALWTGVLQYSQNSYQARSNFQTVRDTLQQVQRDQATLSNLPKDLPPEWDFQVDAPMQVYAAAADYCLGNYQRSLSDMVGLSTVNRDSDTIGLFNIVSELDQERLNHVKNAGLLSSINRSSSALQSEYKALSAIS